MSVDTKKTASAAKALKKYLESQQNGDGKSQLFEDDGEFVYLVVTSKKFFSDHRQFKPTLVELPTPLFKYKKVKPAVCIFTRDPQRDYKDALLDGQTAVTKVVGVSKLKGKHKPFEARRVLLKDHDLFLAEDGVVEMLPKLLGAAFYRKQQSIPLSLKLRSSKTAPINTERANEKINQILHSTVVSYPASSTMRVRIGTTEHSDKELAQNAKAVVNALDNKNNILELDIRTNQSPTLPIFYADKCYSESDIGEEDDPNFETEGQKRKREDQHLDDLLAEVVDEEDIKNYNREEKRRRKERFSGKQSEATEENAEENAEAEQQPEEVVEEAEIVEKPNAEDEPVEEVVEEEVVEEPKKAAKKPAKKAEKAKPAKKATKNAKK